MKRIITLITCILTILNIDAQQQEYIRLTTDKECYLAGEDIWLKVCVSDKDNQPSDISKVAYIEISDPQQVYAQAKIDLTHGMGNGRIRLPRTMHSGAFQLTAYTRYMRNWGEKAFQRQIIAVVNTLQTAEDDRMEWTDSLPKSDNERIIEECYGGRQGYVYGSGRRDSRCIRRHNSLHYGHI
jgi:hypothetical protein